MPYSKMKNGKWKVTGGEMKGKVISDAQRKAIEANKHKKKGK